MRLHQLSITGFGPFAGTEQIDFEDLNDAGLFLLTGPTGAGKTSILDAICFALYGSVPGARGAKTLKSQHSPASLRPEVVLDFSIAERRFVLRRTPEWSRPKLRGSGSTEEKASATLLETSSGDEHLLSARAQEVGHLVSGLIGMSAAQFVQVAMLPQGEFARFLRATSQERHDVLEHVFKTDRFTRIEEWVHDHSRSLRERATAGKDTMQRVLDRMADRVGVELPEELSGDGLGSATGNVLHWARTLLAEADAQLTGARDAHEAARLTATTARAGYDEAKLLQAAITRREAAAADLATLAAGLPEEDAARAALDHDERAARCLPVLRLLDESSAEHQEATAARDAALSSISDTLASVTGAVTSATLGNLEQEVRNHVTRLEVLLPREDDRARARRALATAEADIVRVQGEIRHGCVRRDEIPREIEALGIVLARAAGLATRRELLTADVETARTRVHAARQLLDARANLSTAQACSRDARDEAADARDRMLEAVARRLAGIAAELAGHLQDGVACQVCGSLEHPEPATPAADAVTEQEQEEANEAYDEANTAHQQGQRREAEAERRLDALNRESGGLEADEAQRREAALVVALAQAEAAGTERDEAELDLSRLAREGQELVDDLHAQQTRLAALEQAATTHRVAIAALSEELADAGGDGTPLAVVLDEHKRTLTGIEHVGRTLQDHERAASRTAVLQAQAETTTAEHNFTGLDEARSSALSPAVREGHQHLLGGRAEVRACSRAVLDDPEVRAVIGCSAPDLVAMSAVVGEAGEDERRAARVRDQQEQVVTFLGANMHRLETALGEWAPVRDDSVRADAMAKLVRGMGGDNALQMRLSAYVLATRLDQVVAAANERLAHMRDQRYLLERTGRASRKGAQAGLGLEVVDEWTGDVRDPSTLSGGETFVVSLSLALGLADVVTQEAGGTDIETLFVDEGFGMLDPDTLDDVMDRLDGLRAGGRTVGVVSHVSELRNRIPTQVHVEKNRSGSTIAVRTLVG